MSSEQDVHGMTGSELESLEKFSVIFWCAMVLISLGLYLWLFYISVGAGLIAVILSFIAEIRSASCKTMYAVNAEMKRRRGGNASS